MTAYRGDFAGMKPAFARMEPASSPATCTIFVKDAPARRSVANDRLLSTNLRGQLGLLTRAYDQLELGAVRA